jgi:hypothetical protein
VNGWSSGKSRLNEENKVPVQAWIVIVDTKTKRKRLEFKMFG